VEHRVMSGNANALLASQDFAMKYEKNLMSKGMQNQ